MPRGAARCVKSVTCCAALRSSVNAAFDICTCIEKDPGPGQNASVDLSLNGATILSLNGSLGRVLYIG